MVDRVDHHRQAERVGEEDELLTCRGAGAARRSEKLESRHPLRLRQARLDGERMEVTHKALHELAQPRICRRVESADHLLRDIPRTGAVPVGTVARAGHVSWRHRSGVGERPR